MHEHEQLEIKFNKLQKTEQNLKEKIKELKSKYDENSKNFEDFKKSEFHSKSVLSKKESSLVQELKKRDTEIEHLKSKINSQSTLAKSQIQTKEFAKPTEFTVINDHAAKSDLFANGGIYHGPAKDFMEFTQKNEIKSFESLKEENKSLREALSEIQQMMLEIAEHRMDVVSSIYRKDYDLERSPNLASLKTELFSLNTHQLSKHTLVEIKNNICKFKEFMLNMDKQSIGGTKGDDQVTPSPGLEQIPCNSI